MTEIGRATITAGSVSCSLTVSQSYYGVAILKSGNQDTPIEIASITRTIGTVQTVTLDETKDNTITTGSNYNVTLKRSLTKDMWNTVCLPFAPTAAQATTIFGSGAKFAEFTSVSTYGTTLNFTTVASSALVAGTPYIVYPTVDQVAATPIELTGVALTSTSPSAVTQGSGSYSYTFNGIYNKTSFAAADWDKIRFVTSGNLFKKPSSTGKMKSFRAYISASTSNPAKAFTIDDGETTDISQLDAGTQTSGKVYNLNGQCVGKDLSTVHKGIYIVNGKKIIIK